MASTISAGTSAGTAIAIAGDTSGALALQTNNGTTAVTISTAQNVGIGTTTPTDTSGYGQCIDGNSSTGFGYYARQAGSSTNYLATGISNSNAIFSLANTTGYMAFYTNGGTERMRITSGGQFNVNNTTASFASGLSNTVVNVQANSGQFACYTARVYSGLIGLATTSSDTAAYNAALFCNGGDFSGATKGTINVTNSGTAYNTTSDYRLKENVAPMTGALATVSALKPVTYKWKVDGSNGQGFIAHELAEVVPQAVTGEKDAVQTVDDVGADGKVIGTKEVPKYQGIDTSFLVATLTAAIQELNAKVDAQATTIAELQAKVG
jgi:hypothetical protein